MEAMKSVATTSDEVSIEEDIEEAISAAGSAGSSFGLSEARGGIGVNDIAAKRRNIFGLEGASENESSGKRRRSPKIEPIRKSKEDDEDDDEQFKIDDDQLSGGKLAQHFVLETSQKSAKNDKTFDKEAAEDDENATTEDKSLTNQSTANDVSEIIDEISVEIQQTSSLPIRLSPIEMEPNNRQFRSLDISVTSAATQGASLESMHSEKDNSLGEEVVHVNESLEVTFDDRNLSPLNPSIANNESLINRLLAGTPVPDANLSSSSSSSRDNDIEDLKQKILAIKQSSQQAKPLPLDQQTEIVVKQMERVPSEFSKDVLEDITEESEKQSSLSPSGDNLQRQPSPSGADAPPGSPVNSLHGDLTLTERHERTLGEDDESIVSLKMIQMLEGKVADLENIVEAKDACLASLTMQLDSVQRRESASNGEQPPSSRESGSLMTTSTEYRTLQEEYGCATMDFAAELVKRNELIFKLQESLQQSLQYRENLQSESEKLANEVQLLQKQLSEALENARRTGWPRDQESNGGQRISEISIDLVSESDDDLDRHYLTDNDDKTSRHSRNSRERQASVPRTFETFDFGESEVQPISKQIEQFKKYLTPNEVRLFFMVQKKFDDFLSQELEKFRMKYDGEVKILTDQMTSEKVERDAEINRLRLLLTSVKNGSSELMQLRHEMDAVHAKEMEDLRQYFEKKCADLEKQYSDEVFSQKSQRHGYSSSEASDQEMMPEEVASRSKEPSPRKKTKAELLSSPSHRQLTPNLLDVGAGGDAVVVDSNANGVKSNMDDLKTFYQTKINEIKKSNEETIRKLNEKLKHYESKFPSEDDFMSQDKDKPKTPVSKSPIPPPAPTTTEPNQTSLIIIDHDELNNEESQVIQKIIGEYDRRLQEQVTLAKEDIVRELENQIQALLSETTADDHHWPPELILLREKFTAKSQLEIAQLQIKHEEEMSRLKVEFEKQYNRKVKRNSAFDLSRDFDQIVSERDGLRELSKTLRYILSELMKTVNNREDDLNATLMDEIQRVMANRTMESDAVDGGGDHDLNNSLINCSILSKRIHFTPDVSGLLGVIEDPHLISFVSSKSVGLSNTVDLDDFDLNECLERLKSEAVHLLELSEEIHKKTERKASESSGAEKVDSCEEDGLKNYSFVRASSFNENIWQAKKTTSSQQLLSLPPDLNRVVPLNESLDDFSSSIAASELNFQFHEFKNRLVKAENERSRMQHELELAVQRNKELSAQVIQLRDQLSSMDLREDYQGYGLGLIKSPQRIDDEKPTTSFSQLQVKARHILSSPTQQNNDATSTLLQMIEDFCREGDKVVETSRKDRDDLQSQIDTADKQLKATRQFLEDQAAERELERDEFLREIEKLKTQIRDKEKERNSFENASKEVDNLEQQIKDLTQKYNDCTVKKDKFEVELKASIDKIFVLREIISELETQVETKALNEHCLGEKIQELEAYIGSQNRSNETLQHEVQSLRMEIGPSYQEKIRLLEEKLQNSRPSLEQGMVIDHIVEQLRDIESTLDQKTKNLESLHHSSSSVSCISNPIEDVSVQDKPHAMAQALVSPPQGSPVHPSPRAQSVPIDGLQRVLEKLSKHTRMEEAAVKRIRDLEMQMSNIRINCVELQHERDSLQEKMSEQMQRISALQSRLEEQRHRAEELQRQGSSDLNIRIHDLQSEVLNLKETLGTRDKQVANLKNHLEKSKAAIDRLEAEVAVGSHSDRSLVEKLEAEVKAKTSEIQHLKEKIKSEMINRLALPDLMETMLADKNDEIDHLREQLEKKEKELQGVLELNLSEASNKAKNEVGPKVSARTLSDIVSISDFDEPDVIRRAVVDIDTPLMLPDGMRQGELTMDTSKEALANLTEKRTGDLAVFNSLHPARTFEHPHYFQDPTLTANKTGSTITPAIVPRHINFSEFKDDSKIKESTPKVAENEGKTLAGQLKAAQLQLEEVTKELSDKVGQLEELKETNSKLVKEIIEMQKSFEHRDHDFKSLEEDFTGIQVRLGQAQDELEKKSKNEQQLQSEISAKSKQIEDLQRESKEKSELLSKHEKNLLNYQQNEENHLLRLAELEDKVQSLSASVKEAEKTAEDLNSARAELAEKIILYEKSVLDGAEYQKQIESLKASQIAKDNRIEELNEKVLASVKRLAQLEELNSALETEIEKLRTQTSESSKPFSLDEIAQQVEKELNYSAQLDSNILKAIESEEENNFDVHTKDDNEKLIERDLLNQLESLRAQFELEKQHSEEMRKELIEEKQHSQEIQEQDVAIIEAMRTRLEGALAKEEELHKLLDDERDKCERLMTQITVFQRSEARKSSALLKSPTDSPRRSPRVSEFESELADRLRSEIKLLSAQNERERERATDLQRNLERERSRFDTELNDRIEYSERLKKEMEKVARDKDMAEQEVEHLQERLTLQSQEIESLEARIATLQEAETRRANRRDRQRVESTQNAVELQELKAKILSLETERDHLNQTVALLRYDIERGAQREAKLAEALSNSNSSEGSIPQQFMQKMKEINNLLAENTKENRQMTETVQFLVDERRALQKKCEELESQLGNNANVAELEERANHLLGRYLRVESHRKALVYQKRYLKISLQSYQDSEAQMLAQLNGGANCLPVKKKRRFKTVALAVIAIQRMKFIGRLWFTGKRIVSKSVFTITQQKRTPPITITSASTSPPCRDTPTTTPSPFSLTEMPLGRPLQAPGIIADAAQKFDWSRMKHKRSSKGPTFD